MIRQPRRVHPARHVHCVAPYVVLGFARPDNAGHHGAEIHPHAQHEVVVAVLIQVGQLLAQGKHELGQLGHRGIGAHAAVLTLIGHAQLGHKADSRHVGAADGLDLVDGTKAFLAQQLVIVSNNFVQEPGNSKIVCKIFLFV